MTELRKIDMLRDLVRRAASSPTLANTLWIGAASLATAVLGAAASALYGRTLGVEDFGVMTLLISLITMIVALSDLGISGSMVRFGAEAIAKGDAVRLHSVLGIALRAKIVLGLIVLAGALLLLNPIVTSVFHHVDGNITRYFMLSLVAAGLGMGASFFPPIFQTHQRFREQSLVTVVPPFVKVGLLATAALVFSALSVTVGIWVEIITASLALAVGWTLSPVRSFRAQGDTAMLRREMLSFNKWLALYYVFNLLGGRVDLFLVGGLSDARALGLYGAASKIASIVVIVSNSYLTVLLPDLSSALTPEIVRKKQRNSFLMVALFVAGIAILALLSDFVVYLIFGKDFAGAGLLVRLMCIGLFFTVLSYPLNATLFAWNRSEVFPLMSGVAILALVAGNAFLIPRWGAVGAALAFGIGGAVGFSASLVIYFHHLRKRKA
jgi:O-antigen/teichoic acid export membrane protein